MVYSDTWRVYGIEADMAAANIVKPTRVQNTTPVVWPSASTGYDLRLLGRKRPLLVISTARTANGVTYSVTESATTNGSYTASTTSGDLTKVTADGVTIVTVKRNPAKPFIRVTATGDNASTDVTASVVVVGV
jgi:hypothetical protein